MQKRRSAAIVGVLGAALCASLIVSPPANAQFWGGWGGWDRRPQQPPPQQRQQPQQYNPFNGWFGPSDRRREREEPTDFSRAPGPQKKPDPSASTTIVVVGDAMADWLAYGLEDAFSEKPEVAVVRKHRTGAGLIRYDTKRDVEWPQVIKETVAADKPKFLIMMIGVNDRQQIRERAPTPAAARQAAAPAAKPSTPAAPIDPELQAQQSADQQNAELQDTPAEPAPAPEPTQRGAQSNLGPFEFHTEKWEEAYIRRIDATIAAMKSSGVPVFWVGLPSQRNARASTDSAYLNDLYRQRAEKAGIVYIDVWDGFVDDGGRFNQQGPDFEGQIRRLRAGDGIYFTKAGARKLAHYVERELQRNIANRALPVALPMPEPAQPGARPGAPGSSSRPLAGPVVPLTAAASGGDELMGAARNVRPAAVDPVATRVLTRGEALPAPNGRGDDFAWPRGSGPITVNVEPTPPTSASASATPAVPAASSAAPAAGGAQPKAQPKAPAAPQRTATDTSTDDGKPAPAQKKAAPRPNNDAPRPPAPVRPSASSPFSIFR